MESRSISSAAPVTDSVSAPGAPIARYSWQAMLLHWLLAAIVIGMLSLGYILGEMSRGPTKDFYVDLHRSFGVLALMLVLCCAIGWRLRRTPPPLPLSSATLAAHRRGKSRMACFICASCCSPCRVTWRPRSAAVQCSSSGCTLPQWGWDDKPLRSFFGEVHGIVATALVALIALHVLAALKHLLVNRDQVFQRMLPAAAKIGRYRFADSAWLCTMRPAGWSSLAARRAHNPKVVGSNPAPATSFRKTGFRQEAGFFSAPQSFRTLFR